MKENCQKPDGCVVKHSKEFNECHNTPHFPKHTIKVPKVLAEPTIQVCVEADVKLEAPALEVKRILKDVVLEQCKLLPVKIKDGKVCKAKLFLWGFIRKNIEYATVSRSTKSAVCGDIRHTTAHVPFHCCTEIVFEHGNLPLLSASEKETFNFLNENGMGNKIDKKVFHHAVKYNEQPFCELVSAEFHELDMGVDFKDIKHHNYERTFDMLREKIVLELTVKVLQVQQVKVKEEKKPYPPYHPPHHDDDDDCDFDFDDCDD